MVKVTVTDVNDNRPVFYPTRYTVNLEDSSSTGTEVVAVQATDTDSGNFGTVTYTISSGNTNNQFSIDTQSGVIRLARELPSNPRSYTVGVLARDGGGQESQTDALVNISILGQDQNPPEFTAVLYKFSIIENSNMGALVGKVSATAPG